MFEYENMLPLFDGSVNSELPLRCMAMYNKEGRYGASYFLIRTGSP